MPIASLDSNLTPSDLSTSNMRNSVNQQHSSSFVGETLDARFLEEEDEFVSEIEGLALNAIELVATVVTKDSLYILVKQAVFPIINALAHFLLLTKEQVSTVPFSINQSNVRPSQERLWTEEPNQFVSDDDDEANMRSQRNLIHTLLFQLIERFGDQATQALMIIAEKFMMNHDESHTTAVISAFYEKLSNDDLKPLDFSKEKLLEFVRSSSFDCTLPEHAWKKREVGLLLLGSYSDDIIDFQYKHTSSFDITLLIKNLIADVESLNAIPILVAKSLWCVSRFAEIIASKSTALFLPLFKVAATCLHSKHEFPVRLTASKAIGM